MGYRDDPVFWDGKQWWFWDEDWENKIGPYPTEDAARDAMAKGLTDDFVCFSASGEPVFGEGENDWPDRP
jgi:hypothetical protein